MGEFVFVYYGPHECSFTPGVDHLDALRHALVIVRWQLANAKVLATMDDKIGRGEP